MVGDGVRTSWGQEGAQAWKIAFQKRQLGVQGFCPVNGDTQLGQRMYAKSKEKGCPTLLL